LAKAVNRIELSAFALKPQAFATGHGATTGGIDIKTSLERNAILYIGCQALLAENGTVISFTNASLQESGANIVMAF